MYTDTICFVACIDVTYVFLISKSVIDQRTSITQRMGTSSDIQHKIRDVENELKNFATKDKADEYKV